MAPAADMPAAAEMIPLNPNGGAASNTTTGVRYNMKHSIFKVPSYISRNSDAYSPRVVSIGPYHHGHLVNMEDHKERALQELLRRSNKSDQDFSNELRKSVHSLREAYQQLGSEWSSVDNFLKLMIRDGAFLLEYMRCFSNDSTLPRTVYDGDDPVFGYYALLSLYPSLIPDIIMIENQLPLKVLERLIAVETGKLDEVHYPEVYKLVFNFLGQGQAPLEDNPPRSHVLDVARKAITKNKDQCSQPNEKPATPVHSASELSDAGLRFKVSAVQGISGIQFDHGTLCLAPLCIDTFTEPLFLNSIAFERIRPSVGRQVSSYVAFMAGLIRSPHDSSLLRVRGLIDCRIGDDDIIKKLMNTISENVFFDPYSSLCQVRDSLNDFYARKTKGLRPRIREWIRKLKQTYFDNPWTITSLIAATILLVLTALQTVYSILSYKANGSIGAPSHS